MQGPPLGSIREGTVTILNRLLLGRNRFPSSRQVEPWKWLILESSSLQHILTWILVLSRFCLDLNKESSVEEDNLAAKNEMVKAKGKEKEEKENKSKMSKNGVVTATDSDDE